MGTIPGTELDSIAPVPGYIIICEVIIPISIRINSDAVVDDAVVDDAVVTARSFGMNSIFVIIQNMTVIYGVVARINEVNTMPGVILYGNRSDSIPATRFEPDAADRVVLDSTSTNSIR